MYTQNGQFLIGDFLLQNFVYWLTISDDKSLARKVLEVWAFIKCVKQHKIEVILHMSVLTFIFVY